MTIKSKLGSIPKGKPQTFAAGGRTKMFGAGNRAQTKHPAKHQRPGRTGHATVAPKRPRAGAKP